jgi:hypothetical protein
MTLLDKKKRPNAIQSSQKYSTAIGEAFENIYTIGTSVMRTVPKAM